TRRPLVEALFGRRMGSRLPRPGRPPPATVPGGGDGAAPSHTHRPRHCRPGAPAVGGPTLRPLPQRRAGSRGPCMSFAILGIGTALPPLRFTQAEALDLARALCCRTAEQATWLPPLYHQTGIATRHLAFDPQVADDILHGTTVSQSAFLPTGAEDDHGPTTG